MADHRVVCTWLDVLIVNHVDAHVMALGTAERPGRLDLAWTLEEAYAALQRGDGFYIVGPEGTRSWLEVVRCRSCDEPTLRAEGDLDLRTLPSCV